MVDRKITGCDFFQSIDGKLSSEDLTDEGNKFANAYYFDGYFVDLDELAGGKDLFYELEDSWDNYGEIAAFLGKRFSQWKAGRLKPKKLHLLKYAALVLVILLFLLVAIYW